MSRISTKHRLTTSPDSDFFLAPESTLQRQYEALRAYFVDQLGSVEVARRFGYTHGSFRVLCHQFRHDPDFRARFFSPILQGPAPAPVRDPLRELVVAMRKRNLSVYDIQRELAGTGQSVSINTLTLLLREEGFVRLPRRLDDDGPLRQITIIDLGHEEPTILLTNNFQNGCSTLVTRYAQRMLIENGISEAIQFFHLDALSSMVGLKVDFDLQITLMASSLYRLFAERIGRAYSKAQAKTLFGNLLEVSATVQIEEDGVTVTLDKRAHNPYLVASQLTDQPIRMPWFGNKLLSIKYA